MDRFAFSILLVFQATARATKKCKSKYSLQESLIVNHRPVRQVSVVNVFQQLCITTVCYDAVGEYTVSLSLQNLYYTLIINEMFSVCFFIQDQMFELSSYVELIVRSKSLFLLTDTQCKTYYSWSNFHDESSFEFCVEFTRDYRRWRWKSQRMIVYLPRNVQKPLI